MKVLVADDSLVSRYLLQTTIAAWGHEVVVCSNGTEAWQTLQREDTPYLAILDWMMPGIDGVELCKKIRQHRKEPYTYILLVTAKKQKEDIIAGMNAGADDYITKPFDNSELKVRLRAGERILELQAELISAREILRDQATHDPLTGLWNHTMILDILKKEYARAKRLRITFGVVMADLDCFKCVNDTYGHMAGDAVLREVARRICSITRPYDSIGRYGGEEFLIVLPGCNEESTMSAAEKLRESIDKKPVNAYQKSISTTISMGVVSCDANKEIEISNSLVNAADSALYKAKEAGRNCVVLGSLEEEEKNTSTGPKES